jgi:hypothetical protein
LQRSRGGEAKRAAERRKEQRFDQQRPADAAAVAAEGFANC